MKSRSALLMSSIFSCETMKMNRLALCAWNPVATCLPRGKWSQGGWLPSAEFPLPSVDITFNLVYNTMIWVDPCVTRLSS